MLADNEIDDSDCSVRVAVRIRPQNPRELIDMCRICTTVIPGEHQIILGSDKAFTFDYVYDTSSIQADIYNECVARLVEGALNGYNATVLAYGQTGSGKTYTMGTGFDHAFLDHQLGIIPRAVRHLFAGIENLVLSIEEIPTEQAKSEFSVAVQFIELYNEDIIDLLDPYSKGRSFRIQESSNGEIAVTGATIKAIYEPQDALKYLQQGALARTTASTKMNDQSSRSHAVFTILIRRQRLLASESNFAENDLETLTSKFHFVDLAGSERLKRTLATGERAREGISINCGLLALGNCISALGDKSKKSTHVPYRDSKLTRLLQDSLGGNSRTLMIACVSPSDRDFMETLNTLKYANRARNIKNKVQINQDQSSRTILQLRREIAALQLELLEYKQGKRLIDCEGNNYISDTFNENAMLLADNKRLHHRLKSMQETVQVLSENNAKLKLEKVSQEWSQGDNFDSVLTNIVGNYLSEIEKLQAKLIESEEMYQQLKKSNSNSNSPRVSKPLYEDPDKIINMAKLDLEKERGLLMARSLPGAHDENLNLEDPEPSESESDSEENEMEADLNDINSDIEIKTKLIEQLELSQQRIQIMRQQYEEKLNVLNCKISNTQKERDEVLSNMVSSASVQSKDNEKKVKAEYERKITDMQRELKRLQFAQKEHNRQQRKLKTQEIKLQNLRLELHELKSSKIKLMKKISEQVSRYKVEDNKKSKEIAQLRKEQRRQQTAVLSLQAKMNAKEQILRRKTEEVSALRKSQRGVRGQKISVLALNNKNRINTRTRSAHVRWDNLIRTISHAARNKQFIIQLEKELGRLITQREDLSADLGNIEKRRSSNKEWEDSNEEDNLKINISYVQENIEHVQQAIIAFEEGKESPQNDMQKIQSLLDNVTTLEEAKFLLQRLSDNAVYLTCTSAINEGQLQEYKTLLNEATQESNIQQQLLQYFLSQNSNVQICDLFDSLNLGNVCNMASLSRNGSETSLISNGTYDIPNGEVPESLTCSGVQTGESMSSSTAINLESGDKGLKIRRHTARQHDLLFGSEELKTTDPIRNQSHEPMNRNIIPNIRVSSILGALKESMHSTETPTPAPIKMPDQTLSSYLDQGLEPT
ncbi:kinesin-like protein KIF21A isoform X2 [Scaptodrosophila lebanonensis]|uniref:Kinesin-like protein KIF21A isoform X2 n=1 Tax=Drosophila lebanonensis TaxID=7225 RepID=A0A6J2U6C4_DROLE|nr:kinesin-like protein KIF21A isoform X2 [Scaptodrosophila lebanonensis]